MKSRWLLWLPLALFAGLAVFFIGGLQNDAPRVVTSALVGKPLPAFNLPAGASDRPALDSREYTKGKPRLLNIFASWCVPCAAEAPQLMALADAGVPVDGIAIRDARADVDDFLARHGNPYAHIGLDARSQVQIALGSSGVPETFLVDGEGRILHQHIGDIRAEDVPGLIAKWKAAQ
ncbi:MAG: DsbE family thiol:disulfide interchange protein [Sphingobium sp.]|nr:DsbE family thiol:disulfide interchange protein [Sphingobium sp.]